MSSLRKSYLIKIIQEDLDEYDGKINLYKGRYCGGTSRCSGVFYLDSKDRPIIKVATKNSKDPDMWVGTLIHEYCHFLQWRDEAKVWEDFSCDDLTFGEILQYPKKYKKELVKLISLELDCEKRSVKIIESNKIIDKDRYVKLANAILLKYVYLYHFDKWPEVSIYNKNILNACPTKLYTTTDKYINVDKNILKLFT